MSLHTQKEKLTIHDFYVPVLIGLVAIFLSVILSVAFESALPSILAFIFCSIFIFGYVYFCYFYEEPEVQAIEEQPVRWHQINTK